MRYSRYALLLFGAGMLFGLVVVSAKLPGLGRVASLTMAAGIVLLPVAAIADWRRRAPRPKLKARAKPKARSPKRNTAPARRQARKRR
jgi:multisubunit Na+/H+ antiporter MnhB subunit